MTPAAAAPPVVMQVAQRYTQTSRGVVLFRMHRRFDVSGGLQSRHEDLVMQGIYQDGVIVRVRVYSYTINGRPASASDVAALEQSWEHPNPGDVFAAPYDPRDVSAYRYRRGGLSTIYFTSSVRDAGHGRGSFNYDAGDDVVSVTCQPNALPPHASYGVITDVRSEVLPGYWATTQETQQYKGRYALFAAAGTIQITFSDFRRYPDLQSALNAL